MTFKELTSQKLIMIREILRCTPNSISGSPWLSVYPCKPEQVIDSPSLLRKTVGAAVVLSGAAVFGLSEAIYSYDIIRKDGQTFDIDRHLLSLSGAKILERKKIDKDFPEHHSSEIPEHYL